MNILYAVNSGNPGGMELHIYDLAKGMISKGHNVHIWCKNGDMVKRYESVGALVYVRNIGIDIDPGYILSLRKYLLRNKIEVVHAHDLKAGTNATFAGLFAGVKTRITHIHTPISEWQVPNILKKIFTFFAIRGYSILVNLFSTAEIALTESRKQVKIKEGINRTKLRVIPNGKDLDRYKISDELKMKNKLEIRQRYNIPGNAFVIGNVSRLTAEKGHRLLISTFIEMLDSEFANESDVYLLIGGGGEYEQEFRTLIRDTKVERNIKITGIFEEEDNVKLYNSFDLFVFPSLAEGFGYVLVEAMGSKTPTLCSDLPVLKEVAGDSVRYFKTGDAQDLRHELFRLYTDCRSGSFNLVDSAFQRADSKYSLNAFVENYEALYKELNNK